MRRTPLAEDLVIAAKSNWDPAIRREHALASGVAELGYTTSFIERPADIRSYRLYGGRGFITGSMAGLQPRSVMSRLLVYPRTALLPGHCNVVGRHCDGASLQRLLRRQSPQATLVVTTPWYWAAARRAPQARRVVDFGDDWTTLIPRARANILRMYAQIADEADEIVVASAEMIPLFPGREPIVIRNATDGELLDRPYSPTPNAGRLGFVGTLSERFDAALVAQVLESVPGWTLHLWGSCQYSGAAGRPSADLQQLLATGNEPRVHWHGPVPRSHLSDVLDSVDVLIIPNRPDVTLGQDSMKLYDYSARGRPVISAPLPTSALRPPHLMEAADLASWVQALKQAGEESTDPKRAACLGAERRQWAHSHTWRQRVPEWWRAVRGDKAAAAERVVSKSSGSVIL